MSMPDALTAITQKTGRLTEKTRIAIYLAFCEEMAHRETPEGRRSYAQELAGLCMHRLRCVCDARIALENYLSGMSMEESWRRLDGNPFDAYCDEPEADCYGETYAGNTMPGGDPDSVAVFDIQDEDNIINAVEARRQEHVRLHGWPKNPVTRAMWRYALTRDEARKLLRPVRSIEVDL